MSVVDRSEVSRAVAKAIAYKECGNDAAAEEWARTVVELLQCADILRGPDSGTGSGAGSGAGSVPASGTASERRLTPVRQPLRRRRTA